uniref:Neuroparsin n=1 Tax=Panagrolaimus sp. PS1159 TaxID=55785 RepID=A0AC35FT79_9BILA
MLIEFKLCIVFILYFCFDFCESRQLLWCHQGGAKRNWGPIQCPETTTECFKFDCIGGQDSFVARGCGVSTYPRGLRNESCFQAMEACQFLGGEPLCNTCNNKHMCNSTRKNYNLNLNILFLPLMVIISIIIR